LIKQLGVVGIIYWWLWERR